MIAPALSIASSRQALDFAEEPPLVLHKQMMKNYISPSTSIVIS